MNKIILVIISLGIINFGISQTVSKKYADNTNAWLMYFGDHKFASHWGVHIEGQFRRNDFLTKPQQLLLRVGLNYHWTDQVFFTLGYCFVETYPYGDFPVKSTFPESRLWQQIQIKTQLKQIEWISRFRMEERFSRLPVQKLDSYEPGTSIYTNRFRIFNRLSIPFKGKSIVDKSIYLTMYEEIFTNFGKNVALNIFDQNRLYFALGQKIPRLGRLEVGYLFQTIQKPDALRVERNHTFQLGLTSTLDVFKPKKL